MLTVRPIRAEEHDEVRALLTDAYQPYTAHIAPALYDVYLSLLLETTEALTLVAEADGELVGTARLYAPGQPPVPLPASWSWVRSVGVRPSARGGGVARALMADCAERCATPTLSLHTMDFMPAAVRLYEWLGYRRAPEWDFAVGGQFGLPPEQWFHALAYRLDLG